MTGKRTRSHFMSGDQWQMGKPLPVIHFVYQAEEFMQSCGCERQMVLLQHAIRDIKSGDLVFRRWLTPQEYLQKHQEFVRATAD